MQVLNDIINRNKPLQCWLVIELDRWLIGYEQEQIPLRMSYFALSFYTVWTQSSFGTKIIFTVQVAKALNKKHVYELCFVSSTFKKYLYLCMQCCHQSTKGPTDWHQQFNRWTRNKHIWPQKVLGWKYKINEWKYS